MDRETAAWPDLRLVPFRQRNRDTGWDFFAFAGMNRFIRGHGRENIHTRRLLSHVCRQRNIFVSSDSPDMNFNGFHAEKNRVRNSRTRSKQSI